MAIFDLKTEYLKCTFFCNVVTFFPIKKSNKVKLIKEAEFSVIVVTAQNISSSDLQWNGRNSYGLPK